MSLIVGGHAVAIFSLKVTHALPSYVVPPVMLPVPVSSRAFLILGQRNGGRQAAASGKSFAGCHSTASHDYEGEGLARLSGPSGNGDRYVADGLL